MTYFGINLSLKESFKSKNQRRINITNVFKKEIQIKQKKIFNKIVNAC